MLLNNVDSLWRFGAGVGRRRIVDRCVRRRIRRFSCVIVARCGVRGGRVRCLRYVVRRSWIVPAITKHNHKMNSLDGENEQLKTQRYKNPNLLWCFGCGSIDGRRIVRSGSGSRVRGSRGVIDRRRCGRLIIVGINGRWWRHYASQTSRTQGEHQQHNSSQVVNCNQIKIQ